MIMKQKKNENKFSLFSNVLYCLRFLYKANKTIYFTRIPLILIDCASNFISIIFLRYILNEISTNRNVKLIIYYIAGMVASIFAVQVLKLLITLIDKKQSDKALHRMKLLLGESVMKMKYSDLESPRIKNFIQMAEYSNTFFDVFGHCTAIVMAFINMLGLVAIIMTISPLVFILIGLVVAIRVVREKKWRRKQYQYKKDRVELNRNNNYIYSIITGTQYGKEIRANKLEKWMHDKYKELIIDHVLPLEKKISKSTIKFFSFQETVYLIQEAIVYIYLAFKVVFKGMLIGDFTMYMTSIKTFADYVSGFVGNLSLLSGMGLEINDYRYCMELAKKQDQHVDISSKSEINDKDIKIEFKNVSFKYPNTEKMILKNISICLESQQSLSIVGINGVGKTTFVKLICRFYEPMEGEILLNGMPIQTIPYEDYIKLIGVVFQDFKMFAFSVKENIAMRLNADELLLQKSISESGLESKINSLTCGIDTMISKEFDSEGIEFSGGECQKLAIARAIYKDAPLIILDEPTSALDPIAEYDVYKRFSELADGKCAVYISHRLSSTRFTDKIAVFSDGEICEYGSHNDLMQIDGGIYKNMFDMQAQYYI
ncbi:MAG: ABC transporter ATP-binding protein [Clostridiales bacterium]|nr:ABC transporter ATP-binding protein [Clostridiales bacterium]